MGGDAVVRMARVGCWRWDDRQGRSQPLLADVDWEVGGGQQWAVMGPNGAGKSTLVAIAGATGRASTGTVELLGGRIGTVDTRLLRRRIGIVEPRTTARIAGRLTVREVVLTGATATLWPLAERVDGEVERRAQALLERFGCGAVAGRSFGDCSQGERRRALIARALMRRPQLLILDEPAAGLDLPGREALVEALTALAGERPPLTSIVVTHHPEELASTTTHVLLLRAGRVIAAGPAATVMTSAALTACFGAPVTVERRDGRWAARAAASFLSA